MNALAFHPNGSVRKAKKKPSHEKPSKFEKKDEAKQADNQSYHHKWPKVTGENMLRQIIQVVKRERDLEVTNT